MMLRLFLVLAALVGCKSADAQLTDERLLPYVKEFIADCNLYNVECDFSRVHYIRMYDDLGGIAGSCDTYTDGTKDVAILSGYDNLKTRSVLYHELGHCTLNLEHDTNSWTIMNLSLAPPANESQWRRMVADMFSLREPRDSEVINFRGLVFGPRID